MGPGAITQALAKKRVKNAAESCSVLLACRLICSTWPAFPDLIATLQTIAAAD